MRLVGMLGAVLALGLVGCGGDGSDDARLVVLHASPDAPAVDVRVDGDTVINALSFGSASDSIPVNAGARAVAVNAAGTDTTVIAANLELAKDTGYLVVASNKVARIAPIVAVIDGVRPESGQAKVRVLHGAPSAPAVDVYVVAPGASINSATPVLSGVPFAAISGYLTVPAGSYDVKVTLAGTKTVAIQALGFAIPDGFIGTVAALDAVGGGAPFSLKPVDERE
jgi:hypothetical protein